MISEKIKALIPYTAETGEYPIRLDANESFLQPPDWLREKINAAFQAVPLNRYPDPMAEDVCKLIAQFYEILPEQTVAGNGSDEIINLVFTALLGKNDKILYTDPDFSMYKFYAQTADIQHFSSLRKNGKPDVNELIEASKDCKLIILSNPCNPTGQTLDAQDIVRLVENADCYVVIDEAYMDFEPEGSVINKINDYKNLIVLKTCSKAFGLAAIRLGFAFANTEIINVLKSVKSVFNVSAITQAVGKAVLSEPQFLRDSAKQIRASKDVFLKLIDDLKIPEVKILPSQTNFLCIYLPNHELVYQKLKEKGILVRCFKDFLRVTTGSLSENVAFCNALYDIVKNS